MATGDQTANMTDLILRGRSRMAAWEMIDNERVRQDKLKAEGRFKLTCADAEMSNLERLAVLVEEVGEVGHEVNETIGGHAVLDRAKLRKELSQVAAVALAWLEGLDADERVTVTEDRPDAKDNQIAGLYAAIERLTRKLDAMRQQVASEMHTNNSLALRIKSLSMELIAATVYKPTDDPSDLWAGPGEPPAKKVEP